MKLILQSAARAFLKDLPPKQYKQIVERIFELLINQHPHNSKALKGHTGYFRVAAGEYRIIYTVDSDTVDIKLVDKRNDDEIYKRLDRLIK